MAASPPPRMNSPDQENMVIPGFGIEFEHCLKRAWEDHEDKERGRLAKYARFGMTKEDARRATPEYMREEYKILVADQLADVYTPSPSPSPSIPPTPISLELNDPTIREAYPSQWLVQQDPKENGSHRELQRKIPLYQHAKQNFARRPTVLRSAKAATVRQAVKGSKVKKNIHVRNATRSRHHMETRSRRLAREIGIGRISKYRA